MVRDGGVQMEPISELDIVLRMLAAMMAGALVGGQRAKTDHPAGLRTHMLVAIGSAIVMIVGSMLCRETVTQFGTSPDPARLGAQVVSGVGFLGAGTILKDGLAVRGLTTAASLWAVACLGLAAGMGYYTVVIIGGIGVFVTLSAMEYISKHMSQCQERTLVFRVECAEISRTISEIERVFQQFHLPLEQVSFGRMDEMCCWIRFRATVSGTNSLQKQEALLENLAQLPSVDMLQMEREKRSGYSGSAAAGWHGSEAK